MPKVIGVKDGTTEGGYEAQKKDKFWTTRKKFKLIYYVLGDTTSDTEEEILATVGIPPLFSPVRGCHCKSLQAKQTNRIKHPTTGADADLWEVDADFDNEGIDLESQSPTTPPPAQRPKRKWYGVEEEVVMEKDVLGVAIKTQPGEKIILKTQMIFPILEIVRIENYPFDPNVILDYSNKTNDAPFYGAPVGSALFMTPEAEETEIDGVLYDQVTYKIKFKLITENGVLKRDVWFWEEVLHQGFLVRPAAGQKPIVKMDVGGHPIRVNLAADGTELPEGAPEQFLDFAIRDRVDFNNLNLGPF